MCEGPPHPRIHGVRGCCAGARPELTWSSLAPGIPAPCVEIDPLLTRRLLKLGICIPSPELHEPARQYLFCACAALLREPIVSPSATLLTVPDAQILVVLLSSLYDQRGPRSACRQAQRQTPAASAAGAPGRNPRYLRTGMVGIWHRPRAIGNLG